MKIPTRFQPRPPVFRSSASGAGRARQRGVVLFFALIVLVILLIGGIVVVRSVNSSLYGAGNLAFRRDLVTQGDAVVARAIQMVSTAGSGGTSGSSVITDLQVSQSSANYSAIVLPVNSQGIPTALFSDTGFNAVGKATNDIPINGGIIIRYVIERMCDLPGAVSPAHCVQPPGQDRGEHTDSKNSGVLPTPPGGPAYRLSARVTGPRNTQAFFQTMFSGPN
jgi:hypothetical protein